MTIKDLDLGRIEDVGIVVWAQDPLDSGPAAIFQTDAWFPVVMMDGFESGDLGAWN